LRTEQRCSMLIELPTKVIRQTLSTTRPYGFARNIEFEFQSNGQFPFENNFKGTINCPVTRAKLISVSLVRRGIIGVIMLSEVGYVKMDEFY